MQLKNTRLENSKSKQHIILSCVISEYASAASEADCLRFFASELKGRNVARFKYVSKKIAQNQRLAWYKQKIIFLLNRSRLKSFKIAAFVFGEDKYVRYKNI